MGRGLVLSSRLGTSLHAGVAGLASGTGTFGLFKGVPKFGVSSIPSWLSGNTGGSCEERTDIAGDLSMTVPSGDGCSTTFCGGPKASGCQSN